MTWSEVVAVLALVLAAAALTFGLLAWFRPASAQRAATARAERKTRKNSSPIIAGASSGKEEETEEKPQLAVIVNSTKPGAAALREQVFTFAAARYLPEPLWLSTSDEHRGRHQAEQAIEAGASVILAAGGDGTVREVAGALAGTGAVLGILPQGTGNLLARNLDIPVNSVAEALRIAVEGKTAPIDIGWMRTHQELPTGTPQTAEAHPFTVIGGIGFDANMVADAGTELKRRVGWLAYFWAGAKHMGGKRLRTTVQIDNRDPVKLRVRSLLVGNCGKLPGGIMLLPDAVIDDGWLDIAALDTRAGVAGWADLFGKVMLQGMGVRSELPLAAGRISHTRARRLALSVPENQLIQIDGDVMEHAPFAEFWVQPGALLVRVAN